MFGLRRDRICQPVEDTDAPLWSGGKFRDPKGEIGLRGDVRGVPRTGLNDRGLPPREYLLSDIPGIVGFPAPGRAMPFLDQIGEELQPLDQLRLIEGKLFAQS